MFGVMYFIQGFMEPTEGLLKQPTVRLLEMWGQGPEAIAIFAAWITLPWTIKPLYGVLSDFVPLAGYRRKTYLILGSSLALVGMTYGALVPIAAGDVWILWLVIAIPTFGAAMSDVVVDALMVAAGRKWNASGVLQSVQWGGMWGATILAALGGGALSQPGFERAPFAVCAIFAAVSLWLSIFNVRETREVEVPAPKAVGAEENGVEGFSDDAAVDPSRRQSGGASDGAPHSQVGVRTTFRAHGRDMVLAIRDQRVQRVVLFLFLWNLTPLSGPILQVYMTGENGLRLSEQAYGASLAVYACGALAACLVYGVVGQRVPKRALWRISIGLGILGHLAYLLAVDTPSAMIVGFFSAFVMMIANLMQFELAAAASPASVAATVFSSLMAVCNLATALGTWWGGLFYERFASQMSEQQAFRGVTLIAAAVTACCWLIPRPRDSAADGAIES